MPVTGGAESAIDLLSGFDSQRLQAVYPIDGDPAVQELAKLVYRVRHIDPRVLSARALSSGLATESELTDRGTIGDAVAFKGTVTAMRIIELPPQLAEYLEFTQLHVATIHDPDSDSNFELVTDKFASQASPGDHIEGVGVVIESGPGNPAPIVAIATADVRWFPQQVKNQGWRLLRDAGVDMGLMAGLAARNRRPLETADSDAFYAWLGAARAVARADTLPTPQSVQPLDMLQQPDELVGQWLEIDVQTVQITRVTVSVPQRREALGGDHYFQIDAIGDLQQVVVEIQPSEPGEQKVSFQGRYPVSLVVAELPEFLRQRMAAETGDDSVVTSLHTKIRVRGFFFRLWSYESEYMTLAGGGKQFGPLIVAAQIMDLEPPAAADPPASDAIAIAAAGVVLAAIVGIFWWHRKTEAQDRAIRQTRQDRQSERTKFPSNST
jgi:hypothetical protein